MGVAEEVEALGVLMEPQRRRVYEFLAASTESVSLTEASEALEIGRTLCAFHLNKLVEAGFVEVTTPESGRRGRPAQRYIASRREISASVPARHYELVAQVLLSAANEQQPAEPLATASTRVARRLGEVVGLQHRSARPVRTERGRQSTVLRLLDHLGYQPRTEATETVLRNCPFDRLRDTNCDLVCGINHALAEGYLDGLGFSDELSAELRPTADRCCVVVTTKA